LKHWWVVYKVNPEIDTCLYDAYMETNDDDDFVHVYQEENKGHQSLSFTISDGVGHAELAICDVQLMEEEPGPSKKRLQKSRKV
jgi:hypothetical protein